MRLDIEQVIDGARLGPLHWRVLILCALATLLDGYDIQAMAAITPTLAAQWHVPPSDLRWIITAALVGIAGAALIVSPLGDYFGRRRVLLSSFALVGVATLLAANAHDATELFAWRFLTGVGARHEPAQPPGTDSRVRPQTESNDARCIDGLRNLARCRGFRLCRAMGHRARWLACRICDWRRTGRARLDTPACTA